MAEEHEDPYPSELVPDLGFAKMVAHLCVWPAMYVGRADNSAVVAYIDGFSAARGGGPLLGFREWLVVKANAGVNIHWAGLVKLLTDKPQEDEPTERKEGLRIQAIGRLIDEYLAYRERNGITKVYYKYAKWLLRRRWYHGPLRNPD